MNKVKQLFALFTFFFSLSLLPAQDFGLVINNNFVAEEESIEYTATGIPWFSSPLGAKADLYLSGGISAKYKDENWIPVYEVYRSEVKINPVQNFSITLGRQAFRDSLGLVMSGLFDGLAMTWNTGGNSFNAGIFYTGLLYKESASIFLSEQDRMDYLDEDIYFAPKRLAGGINWERTSIFNTQANLWLSGIFQQDLSGAESKINSQYIAGKFSVPFHYAINMECGAVFELMQETGKDLRMAIAAATDLNFLFSGTSMLSLGGRYSSGTSEDWKNLTVFSPVTSIEQGKILRPSLSGIALAQISYTARMHKTFSCELFAAYLFRTDTSAVILGEINEDSQSPFLGAEFNIRLTWMPFSDIIFSLNGGLFLPQTGDIFIDEAKIKHRLELTASFSF
ncbi:MAG: hypothetical protein LBU88_01155 [Treponema sp.]|jgi:hypothetical protein|nr:hypothetical protein [Treponema sp.]